MHMYAYAYACAFVCDAFMQAYMHTHIHCLRPARVVSKVDFVLQFGQQEMARACACAFNTLYFVHTQETRQ